MTDLTALKANYRLSETLPNLKKVGAAVWAGPCPFCGGNDRFQVKRVKDGELWICRKCGDGKYHDAIDLLAQQHNLPLRSAQARERYAALQEIARLLGGALDQTPAPVRPAPIPTPRHAPDWQTAAYEILHICKRALWFDGAEPQQARAYLTGPDRLLTDNDLLTWDLGYSCGFEHGGLWIPRGIVIPCFEYGEVWYFKIRLLPGQPCKCSRAHCRQPMPSPGVCPSCGKVTKYLGVTGNQPGLFGAGTLNGSSLALVCEGEFDAMHLWRAVGRLPNPNQVAVITTGASSHAIDPVTWGRYGLLNIKTFISILDQDEAGEQAHRRLEQITPRAIRAHLPAIAGQPVKDVTDFVRAGGDLTAWLQFQLEAA